jgi:hypothetical protein
MKVSIKFAPAIAVVLALTLTGCGGGGKGGSTSTSATATAPSAAPACQAGDLRSRFVRAGAGLGNDLTAFAVRNASRHTCTLAGFPRVILLDAAGNPVAVRARPKGIDYFGTTPKRVVELTPSGSASFHFWSTFNVTKPPCANVRGFRIFPPGDGSSRYVRFSFGRVAPICSGGITVSRFEPGHTAYK